MYFIGKNEDESGRLIEKNRIQNHLTIRELCIISGVSEKTYRRIRCNGAHSVSVEAIKAICDVLNMDISEVI